MHLEIFCDESCKYQKSGICTLDSAGAVSSTNPRGRDCLYFLPRAAQNTALNSEKSGETVKFEVFF